VLFPTPGGPLRNKAFKELSLERDRKLLTAVLKASNRSSFKELSLERDRKKSPTSGSFGVYQMNPSFKELSLERDRKEFSRVFMGDLGSHGYLSKNSL